MTTINTALAFDSNDKAQLKLHVVELLEKKGWETVTIAFPGVSRASAFRWKKKYLESEKRLTSLLPKSTKPTRVREMTTPAKIMGFVKKLREKYPRLSKYKIKPFLDIFCQENDLPKYSVSWIGKLIKRYRYFFNERKQVRRKRRTQRKNRVKYCPGQNEIELGYLQLDGIRVDFEGGSYYFLSAIELKTRQAFNKRVPSLSSKSTRIFLEEILESLEYQIHSVQTDNGSEFHKEFEKAVDELGIKHLWSYPRKPKTNGYVERFNWTVQDEFINYEIDTATYDLALFDKKLDTWVKYYNQTRPHQSLGYMTPNQYLLHLQKGGSQSLICP